MLRHTTIPLARAWNTWSSRPAEMVFLPLGVRLAPLFYANSTGRASSFEAGDTGVLLGHHAIDASVVELELTHARTTLAWTYHKPDPFIVLGSWRAKNLGEWGLRFWVNLCLSTEEGHEVRFDAAAGAAIVRVGHRFAALVAEDSPVQVTGHASIAALADEYEKRGYFYLGSRSSAAQVLALRFNLEMTRETSFACAIADREDLAVAKAREAVGLAGAREDSRHALPAHTGRAAGALDAVRDVIGWNTIWDETNARPYTCISRNWNVSKFGGYGVWLNDQQYAALFAGLLDPELAHDNLAVWLASSTPQGNLACLLTANDAWVDRTQLPLGTFLLWLLFLRSRSRPLLELAYATLARNHAWWWQNRDPEKRGLVSYGTSDVGDGLYKGTHFGARNESSMDNSPIHEEAEYDSDSRTLTTIDVGLNSLLALDAEMLGLVAYELGHTSAAETYRTAAEALRRRIREELWDESRGVFANRLRNGQFVRSIGPTSFYPLICGAANADQIGRLIALLDDPQKFGGRFVLPGTARDDPAYKDNTYWRGRIWPPLNYLVWQGLRRCGEFARASQLAQSSFELFRRVWEERRLCPENFNAETGEPLDQPDTEGFYNWGALMPLMAVGEIMDVSPWRGWEFQNTGEDLRVGPLQTPVGAVMVVVENGVLRLAKGERELFATNMIGRFSHVRFEAGEIGFDLPGEVSAGSRIWLSAVNPKNILLARISDTDLAWDADGSATRLTFTGQEKARRIRILVEVAAPEAAQRTP
jgi:putative isomerase